MRGEPKRVRQVGNAALCVEQEAQTLRAASAQAVLMHRLPAHSSKDARKVERRPADVSRNPAQRRSAAVVTNEQELYMLDDFPGVGR